MNSRFNSLWGLFTKVLGKDSEALNVYESMQNMELVNKKGLVIDEVNEVGIPHGEGSIWSINNAIYGIFLQSIGKKKEALDVLKSLKNLNSKNNLEGLIGNEDGLVINGVCLPDIWHYEIDSLNNSFYGMFLKAIGKNDEALNVYESMQNIGLVNKNGLVIEGVARPRKSRHGGLKVGDSIESTDNAVYGLFLQSLGKQNESNNVGNALNNKMDFRFADGVDIKKLLNREKTPKLNVPTDLYYGLMNAQGFKF